MSAYWPRQDKPAVAVNRVRPVPARARPDERLTSVRKGNAATGPPLRTRPPTAKLTVDRQVRFLTTGLCAPISDGDSDVCNSAHKFNPRRNLLALGRDAADRHLSSNSCRWWLSYRRCGCEDSRDRPLSARNRIVPGDRAAVQPVQRSAEIHGRVKCGPPTAGHLGMERPTVRALQLG